MNEFKLFCLFVFTICLNACGGGGGGGGGSGSDPNKTQSLVGVFLDSPVSGLNFRTKTISGKTNANGEFQYLPGETVTFSIGNIDLPTVSGNATVTPLDLAKTSDLNNQVVTNLLVLLQSVDADANPDNGIQISSAAHIAASKAVDFNVSTTNFRVNSDVTNLIANSGSANRTLVLMESALNHFRLTLGKVNVAPIANAGIDQTAVVGTTATLNGSASSDANGDSISYSWTIVSKPINSAVSLSNPTTVNPTFSPDQSGNYIFKLIVSDSISSSTASNVTVTASTGNIPPIADSGVSKSVTTGSVVTLNGFASNDANGDPLTYKWTLVSKPSDSNAVLSNLEIANPTFVADKSGNYVFALVVNDGNLSSSTSTVTITASTTNLAPIANAGNNLNVYVGTTVTLDGKGSYDPNGDAINYSWFFVSKPSTSKALFSSSSSNTPTFIADAAGSYVISLTVGDGILTSNISTVTITASDYSVAPAISLYLYGGNNNSVYLGCLTCNQYDNESICNKFGTYGNSFNNLSIWNQFGTYGNSFNSYSPWNSFSSYGPVIIGSNGFNYGYFTTNAFKFNRTLNQSLLNVLNYYSSSRNLTSTRSYACGN